jgi:hypothetical protein
LLADLARVFHERGDVDRALSSIEFALVRSDRLPATALAMVQVMQARYLATLGRVGAARRAIEAADLAMAEHEPGSDPVWLCYYDRAEHEGSGGRALIPLAVAAGRAEVARPRLQAAIDHQQAAYPRSKVFSSLRLATLHLTLGELEQGAGIAADTMHQAARLDSGRVSAELVGLHRTAASHRGVPVIADLCDLITTTIRAAPAATGRR